jgi:hypothetical protein
VPLGLNHTDPDGIGTVVGMGDGRRTRRVAAAVIGLTVAIVGLWLSVDPYRDVVALRRAEPCLAGKNLSPRTDCVARETGRVVGLRFRPARPAIPDEDRGFDLPDYSLEIKRASGRVEKHSVNREVYGAARVGTRVDLETWRGRVVRLTVGGQSYREPPTGVLSWIGALLLAWAGVGVVALGSLSAGRLRRRSRICWTVYGAATLALTGCLLGYGLTF